MNEQRLFDLLADPHNQTAEPYRALLRAATSANVVISDNWPLDMLHEAVTTALGERDYNQAAFFLAALVQLRNRLAELEAAAGPAAAERYEYGRDIPDPIERDESAAQRPWREILDDPGDTGPGAWLRAICEELAGSNISAVSATNPPFTLESWAGGAFAVGRFDEAIALLGETLVRRNRERAAKAEQDAYEFPNLLDRYPVPDAGS